MAQRHSLSRISVALAFAAALLVSTRLEAATSVTLAWDASTDTSVTGYIVAYGTRSGSYSGQVDVGKKVQYTLLGIPAGTYFFVVKAYSSTGLVSDPSNEVSTTVVEEYLAATKAPDFDGDHRSDIAVWRASSGAWDYMSSAANMTAGVTSGVSFGSGSVGDVPLSGDVDGDGKADLV